MTEYVLRSRFRVPVGVAFSDLIACVVRVGGASMQPTLNPEWASPSVTTSTSGTSAARSPAACPSADWVLVEKVSYKWRHRYRRGDVAVLWAPDAPREQIVKRVIAIEGDVVDNPDSKSQHTVPQGRCWVEGDNLGVSGDSRTLLGPVHLGLLEGRVTYIVWPPSRIGPVHRHVPPGRVLALTAENASPRGSLWRSVLD